MREPCWTLRSIDFSPDGRFLVTTGFDPEYGELRETIVWDATGDSLKKLHSLMHVWSVSGSAPTVAASHR